MTNEPVIKTAEASGLVCVQLDVHLWSGRKKLRKEDLIAQNPALADLPPESLASMGSVKIADDKDLLPFQQFKRKAELLLRSQGLPMLGSTGIPDSKLPHVFNELTKLKEGFENKRKFLENEFDSRVEEWRNKDENAAWSHLIKAVPSAQFVAGRMIFGMHFVRVSAPSDDMPEVNEGYHQQLTGLKGELFSDAKEEADKLLFSLMAKDAFGVVKKREKITPKTLGPLRRIEAKFRSFAFLDPSVEPLADMIEHVLALMPDGQIDGVRLVDIWSLARILSDPNKAMDAAKLAATVKAPNEAFENLLTDEDDAKDVLQVQEPQLPEMDDTPAIDKAQPNYADWNQVPHGSALNAQEATTSVNTEKFEAQTPQPVAAETVKTVEEEGDVFAGLCW